MTLCLCSFFLPEKRFSNLEDDKSEISISNEEVIINEENEILNKKTNEELIEKSNDIQTAKVHAPNCDCKNCFRLWNFLRKKEILKPIIFILVFTSIPSIASPMFYFYTNVLNFTPEFMGQLRVISAVASAFAVLLYNCFLKLVKFKNIFFWTAILSIISQLFLLILITRYNIKLGIHDKVFSICDNLFIHMMGELNLIPVLVFACRICPKNVEGTMYALIMSTLNLGSLISEQTGALFIYLLEISSTNFTYLWLLIVIESAFIVLLLPFLFCLKINEAQMIAKGENPDRKNYESDNEKSNNKSFENIQNKTKDENSIKKLDKKI